MKASRCLYSIMKEYVTSTSEVTDASIMPTRIRYANVKLIPSDDAITCTSSVCIIAYIVYLSVLADMKSMNGDKADIIMRPSLLRALSA